MVLQLLDRLYGPGEMGWACRKQEEIWHWAILPPRLQPLTRRNSLHWEAASPFRAVCHQRAARCPRHSAELANSKQLSAPVLLNYLPGEGTVCSGSYSHHFHHLPLAHMWMRTGDTQNHSSLAWHFESIQVSAPYAKDMTCGMDPKPKQAHFILNSRLYISRPSAHSQACHE